MSTPISLIGSVSPSRKVLFVGGVHGVGKTTFCRALCDAVGAAYLSAGSLIAGGDAAKREGKVVRDVDANQSILIDRLGRAVAGDKLHVLDGHFCLRTARGIEKIDVSVFRAIAPIYFMLLVDEPARIYARGKDKSGYESPETVADFQRIETTHSRFVSQSLGVPLLSVRVENYRESG